MDEMQHNINALRKRLASHMSDGLAKNVAEARERRDQLMKQKESLEDQVQRLQERVDKVDNSKKSLLAKSDHLDALASREETLRELIRRMRVKLSLKMPNSAIERRQIHMKSSATTVYLHEPAPPGFPEVEEVSAKTRKPLPVPGELAPGEELTASWRSDLAEPLIDGLTACRNCVRENGAAFGPHFEDPNFDSISSRLEMNGAFEAAMDAVLKMLREDMASIQHDSITRVRTRFSMYTKLLGMQTAQKMPVSPAKVAALRVGTIWRERARRGSLQRLQDALETSRQQEQTQKGEGEKEKQ
ncbi:Hypothetical Protein FCC1311_084412 [Hondaea fermentalgiana]|uniref:Uncharacterized protein n=1 Tax=Hondaea fermentalgiana TaxID=2315210 RepID=A0A2R5GMU9_9STRA|nr:Hypothetical Protein FCC1311_084412 [Hondaea fermentalgiana]|eukprot:GBG32216.1 Hypothetical Protein FCC1311_084412 [Hondaea fermentalgiana]